MPAYMSLGKGVGYISKLQHCYRYKSLGMIKLILYYVHVLWPCIQAFFTPAFDIRYVTVCDRFYQAFPALILQIQEEWYIPST